ncbi:DUF535 domain-containing protein [Vibrio sp. B1Z05]|nr:DUF535 domain-containing protein [Vibrio sp. B1Z05]
MELASLHSSSDKKLKHIWLQARFYVLSKMYHATYTRIESLSNNNDVFRSAIEQKPRLIEKALKPYLFVDLPVNERMKLIEQHFDLLNSTFNTEINQVFGKGLPLVDLTDSKGNQFTLILFDGEMREGSLGLRLINDLNQTIYSITFNLSTDPEPTLHVGALKGPSEKIEDRNQVIKTLTRSFHGLRPKALMVEVALMFGKSLGINKFVGVSNRGHIYQALRYKGSKSKSVTFDYDELWAEYGAEKADKYRYLIPANPERKDPSELKKTKRRLYTKRYAWLDELETNLSEKIKSLSVNHD